MPMTFPFDELERRAAVQLESRHPGWLVMWGTYTRVYWAFPRFNAPAGSILATPDAAELTTRMRQAELAASGRHPAPPRQPDRRKQPRQ